MAILGTEFVLIRDMTLMKTDRHTSVLDGAEMEKYLQLREEMEKYNYDQIQSESNARK